jgi:hypothetical protein
MSCSSELKFGRCYDCSAPSVQSDPNLLANCIFYDQVPCLEPATVSFTLKNCYSLDPVIEFVETCPLFVGRGRDEMIDVLEDLNELAESLYLYHFDVLDIYHMERNILRIHIVRPAECRSGCEKSSNRRNSNDSCNAECEDREECEDRDREECEDRDQDECEDRDECVNRDECENRDECRKQDRENQEECRVESSPSKSSCAERKACPDETCREAPEDGEKSEETREETRTEKWFHRISLDLADYRHCQEKSAQSGYSSDSKYALAMVTAFVAALAIPTITLILRSASC